MVQFYEDNVLNKWDNVTYNWTMYMIRPDDVFLYDKVKTTNRVKIIAQSGVESEINIASVTHDMKLSFNKTAPDREAVGNVFSIQLTEPQGATLYTRIFKAAQDLGIPNHLKACYLLELRFLGYDVDGKPVNDITEPYHYVTNMTALDFNYSEGATQYRADLVETTLDAFKRLILHIKEDINITASTYGEYLQNLEKIVNEQEEKQVILSSARTYAHVYKLGLGERAQDWASWGFGTGANSNGETKDLSSVSITGEGTLVFNVKQGTSLSDLMIIGLMQTDKFRRLPTDEGGFHKENADDPEAKAETFADISKWFAFDTEISYDVYDTIARDYAKTINYNIMSIAVPELHHDVLAYEKLIRSNPTQTKRLKNIINKQLLKKRFDYTYTGLNTEVLGLDIYLNNTYYQIQALNQGGGRFAGQAFEGQGGPDNEYNRVKASIQDLNNKIQGSKDELASVNQQLQNINSGNITGPESNSVDLIVKKVQTLNDRREQLETSIRQDEAARDILIEKARPLQQAERNRVRPGVNSITGGRYLTQSELLKINPDDEEKIYPLTHDITNINSKATNGPDEKDTSGAVFLGAVELNLNSLGDLAQQQISIKGDPYWLGRPKSRKATEFGANYTRGGVSYFLNLNFPTYPNPDTGLMQIPEANYGIVGVYRVYHVIASYQEGQFTMTLEAFRDTNTNVGMMWKYLSTGEIDLSDVKKGEPLKLPEDQGEGEQEGNELDGITGPELIEEGLTDGDVTNPSVTELQLTNGARRNLPIKSKLKNILQSAADATGLNVEVFSGGMATQIVGTKRHKDGTAADVNLRTADGTLLTLDNPDHVGMIQNFLKKAKDFGATGIGAGNGYMGNDGFHIDIAKEFGNTGPNSSDYWGGPTARSHLAPEFLKDIMTG